MKLSKIKNNTCRGLSVLKILTSLALSSSNQLTDKIETREVFISIFLKPTINLKLN